MAAKPNPTIPTKFDPTIFKKMSNGIGRGLSFVIYADPGTGKTHMAGTLEPSLTLVINTDAGVGPLLGRDFTVVTLDDSLEKLDWLYKFLRTEKHPWKFIVIDNLSELQKRMVSILTEGRRKDFPEIGEYGNASYKMREYIRLFRDLTELNMTVIFNCWEALIKIKDDGGIVQNKIGPDIFDKLVPELCGIVDAVGHLEVYEKTGDRYVRFSPNVKNLMAKCQFEGLDDCEPADFGIIIDKLVKWDYTKGKP